MLDDEARRRSRVRRALAACLLLGAAFVGCASGPEWAVVHEPKNQRSAAAIRAGRASVEALGREALDALGYERIIELSMQAGFITRKPASEVARTDRSLLAMDGAVATQVFMRVFTKKAVTAGITSQLDGPEPGPADAVAIGLLVLALVQSGVAVYDEIEKSNPPAATTSAPPRPPAPVASATGAPSATPMPTVTSPPREPPRTCDTEYPDLRVCTSLPEEYTYSSVGAALAQMKARSGKKGLQLHNEDQTRSGPCPGTGKHYNVRDGKVRAGSITRCPCCVDRSPGPQKTDRCRIVL